MLKFWLVLLACVSFAPGCTVAAAEDSEPMPDDGRILDERFIANLGVQKDFEPAPVGTVTSTFIQDLPLMQLTGKEARDAELLTLAMSAFQTTVPPVVAPAQQTMIYGVLRFGTGTAQFGAPTQTNAGLAGVGNLSNEVVFDVQNGVQVTFPASAVTVLARYLSVRTVAAPWAVGQIPGPNFLINAGIAYGSKTNGSAVTKTDVLASVANGTSGIFKKAPFAKSVRLTWKEYSTVGPMTVRFHDGSGGNQLLNVDVAPNTLPIVEIPWPNGAQFVSLVNPTITTITSVLCQQVLSL